MLIVEFLEGKNIFLTGGSGFIGKVLIEKLLRSCPKIGTIYVLLREKKGKSLESRIEYIKTLPLFDKLREENPDALKKIVAVKGDVCELNLGLSEADRKTLIEKVNIIYHTAASVRFDDFLSKALIINVRGTRETVKLALELKKISLFVHMSTTYCNTDQKIIEERLYPPHADWNHAIKLAEECDATVLNTMALKYADPLPNTYTFAKSLAEQVVNDMCKGKIPAIILRPSVVISAFNDPIPGWHDNFNGPVGIQLAGGKGLMRIVLGNKDCTPDYIPVDILIRGLIVATHHFALKRNLNEVEVLNGSQQNLNYLKISEVEEMGKKLVQDSPFTQLLWYPRWSLTRCWYNYYIQVLLFHMLPAFFLDIGLRLAGHKPILVGLQRKIYVANSVLNYYMENSWTFPNKKIIAILEKMNEGDKKQFEIPLKPLPREEIYDYYKAAKIGAGKFILKEEYDEEKGKKNLLRFWYMDVTMRTIFHLFLFWFLAIKINLIRIVVDAIANYIRNV